MGTSTKWEKTTNSFSTAEKLSTTHFSEESKSKLRSSTQNKVVYPRLKSKKNSPTCSRTRELLVPIESVSSDFTPNSVVVDRLDSLLSMIALMTERNMIKSSSSREMD